jgi:hypothetical protein
MKNYLIVIEASNDADPTRFHYQPYRVASSIDEARELMRDYMRIDQDAGALVPDFFAVYPERDGNFLTSPEYYDPCSMELNVASGDAVYEWLAVTGRC